MARLILEEGGQRRAFRVNEGLLTIGSSESCMLTLTSEDVAEIHAELEVRGEEITLRPRPGVTPPKVLGKAITQPTRLPKSAEFRIGSAVFRLEPDGQAKGTGARAGAAPGAVVKRGEGSGPATPRVSYSRRTVQRGIPTWMILAIIAVIGVVGYFGVKMWLGDGAVQFDPNERVRVAAESIEEGAYARAADELDRVDPQLAGPELMEKVAELRSQIAAFTNQNEVDEWNIRGSKELQTQLDNYKDQYLQGDQVDRAKARLFVKRCDAFAEKYPQHPELDRLARFRKRFAPVAKLNEPATLDDVSWEVTRLTAAKPRDYELVFELLDEFLSRAGGADRDAALALMDTQLAERQEYFDDRMLQASWEWERKSYGKAVGWLVSLIIMIGDEEMEQKATDAFLRMKTVDGQPVAQEYLGGYKEDQPATFEKLISNPDIREAARDAGLL